MLFDQPFFLEDDERDAEQFGSLGRGYASFARRTPHKQFEELRGFFGQGRARLLLSPAPGRKLFDLLRIDRISNDFALTGPHQPAQHRQAEFMLEFQ